jgi:hypothetical protein
MRRTEKPCNLGICTCIGAIFGYDIPGLRDIYKNITLFFKKIRKISKKLWKKNVY